MHTCEFCSTEFKPRPQVKRPRACQNCQKLRQSANEKAWRSQHLGLYDGKYHSIKRNDRRKLILDKIKDLIRCLSVGGTLLGLSFSEEVRALFVDTFFKFFWSLGIKHANKFWPHQIPLTNADL